jgi:uncharacterized protein
MSTAGLRRLDHEHVIERLYDHARRTLASRPEVREVTLIGSLARGDWSARSDADLVVVVDRATERIGLRSADYVPVGAFPVPVDVFVYTPGELAELSARFRAELERGSVLFRRSHRMGEPAVAETASRASAAQPDG